MIPMRFTLDDAQKAFDTWGCNCGPTALAAMTHKTLDDVRPALVGFDDKHYTNPTMMFDALQTLDIPFDRVGKNWPLFGLARIQWEGPWTEPGANPKWAYRQTHWVGTWFRDARGVFDCNALGNGTGWCSINDWKNTIVPYITAEVPRANGKWHVTHGVELAKPKAFEEIG